MGLLMMQPDTARDGMDPRPTMVFVGAFPPPGVPAFGGHVTDCQTLMRSALFRAARILPIDTTQASRKRPNVVVRAVGAFRRAAQFVALVESSHPNAVFLLAAGGLSFIEKALLASYARARGVRSLFSVPSGHFMTLCRRSRTFRWIASMLLRGSSIVLCQGPSWLAFFTDELGVRADRCRILENWAATPELLALAHSRERASPTRPTLLFIGSVARSKGVFDLLEVVATLASDSTCPSPRVVIAGDGPDFDDARNRAVSLGIQTHVEFTGPLFGASKLAAFRSADAFVLPSYAEGLPNAMVEAMAAGLPVVVTAVGSIPDVVKTDENGLLISPGDQRGLLRALRRLLEDSALRESLGQAAHRQAAARFGAERAAAAIYEMAFSQPIPSFFLSEETGRDVAPGSV